jgi:hypothetical protein
MSSGPSSPQLGSLRRRLVSLLTATSFAVLSVSGVLLFVRPFSLPMMAVHALMGFVFIGLILLHVINNVRPLKGYLHSRSLWLSLLLTAGLSALFGWQPAPIQRVLSWSGNLGPQLERFEWTETGLVFEYSPALEYRMKLQIQPGPAFRSESLPQLAVWLENQGGYHIKTLLAPPADGAAELPYYAFKHAGWEKARLEAEQQPVVDAVAAATPNGSFDPADYILPADPDRTTPYQLLVEIHQPGDPRPSLVYAVEIDNRLPVTYQLLELRGYPALESAGGPEEKESWSLYYVDDSFTTALDLIDSALLTLFRR